MQDARYIYDEAYIAKARRVETDQWILKVLASHEALRALLAEATQRAERAERDADDWQYLAELNYEGAADMVNLQAVRERNEILARERTLRTALEKAEWYEWYEFNDFAESPSEKALLFHQCPSCDGVKERNGHEEGCNTASALAATPAAAPEVKQGKVVYRGKAVPKPGLPEEPSLS